MVGVDPGLGGGLGALPAGGFAGLGFNDGRYIDNTSVSGVILRATGVIPEPGTWAMMIAGFGLVGAAFRRRRSAETLTA